KEDKEKEDEEDEEEVQKQKQQIYQQQQQHQQEMQPEEQQETYLQHQLRKAYIDEMVKRIKRERESFAYDFQKFDNFPFVDVPYQDDIFDVFEDSYYLDTGVIDENNQSYCAFKQEGNSVPQIPHYSFLLLIEAFKLLRDHKSLTELSIGNIGCGDDDCGQFDIRNLDVAAVALLKSILVQNKSIKTLTLDFEYVRGHPILSPEFLMSLLKLNTTLEHLIIGNEDPDSTDTDLQTIINFAQAHTKNTKCVISIKKKMLLKSLSGKLMYI
ncbi:hypothetical protein CYY_009856, partial [Polysphondylium violaceum]